MRFIRLLLLSFLLIPAVASADWTVDIQADGENKGGVSSAKIIIGLDTDEAQKTEAPPLPPEYSCAITIYDDDWRRLSQDIRLDDSENQCWVIGVNPHGNVGVPEIRTTRLSWDIASFGPGNFSIYEGYECTGVVAVEDMKTVSYFEVTGKNETLFYSVVYEAESDENPDSDGDGYPDSIDLFPGDPTEWIDSDADGIGNNMDDDDDNDGMPDIWERQYGLNPLSDDAKSDPDGDGVTNIDEYIADTNPLEAPAVESQNHPPSMPLIGFPVDGQTGIGLTPIVMASDFEDTDEDDTHSQTQWQISVSPDFSDFVMDETTAVHLTQFDMPDNTLIEGKTYYIRVRYFDATGDASPWSNAIMFITEKETGDMTFSFDFYTGAQGWTGGFADYPVDDNDFYELGWNRQPLPESLRSDFSNEYGIYITGNNHSDDLFMFIKKHIEGLLPDTEYEAFFSIDFATNSPSGCIGVGGAPGEAVFLKAGAAVIEPMPIDVDGDYRMNIDKGNQSTGGVDAIVLGDIANGSEDCLDSPFLMKNLSNIEEPFTVTTDVEGRVWLIIGTDSGFESTTELFYSGIEARFELAEQDSDGDGVPDDLDVFPDDPNEWADADHDGIGDNTDTDDDNDGMPDEWEIAYGFDPLADNADEDFDGDGFSNYEEYIQGTDPTSPPENHPPEAPELITPVNQQTDVSLTPALFVDAFYDIDGDAHAATDWQVSENADFSTLIIDHSSTEELTEYTVPDDFLEYEATYYWRARFFDAQNAASDWSAIGSFTTLIQSNPTPSADEGGGGCFIRSILP